MDDVCCATHASREEVLGAFQVARLPAPAQRGGGGEANGAEAGAADAPEPLPLGQLGRPFEAFRGLGLPAGAQVSFCRVLE